MRDERLGRGRRWSRLRRLGDGLRREGRLGHSGGLDGGGGLVGLRDDRLGGRRRLGEERRCRLGLCGSDRLGLRDSGRLGLGLGRRNGRVGGRGLVGHRSLGGFRRGVEVREDRWELGLRRGLRLVHERRGLFRSGGRLVVEGGRRGDQVGVGGRVAVAMLDVGHGLLLGGRGRCRLGRSELPGVDVGCDVGELAAGRDDEACVVTAERLADVPHQDVVRRIGDRHDRELAVEGVRQRPEEARLLLGEEHCGRRVDDLLAEGDEVEALLACEQAGEVDLGDEAALREDLAEPLAGLHALLEGALDRLRGQEAGTEDERAERGVGAFAEGSAHRLSITPRSRAAQVARGLRRFHFISRRGSGLPLRPGLSIVRSGEPVITLPGDTPAAHTPFLRALVRRAGRWRT